MNSRDSTVPSTAMADVQGAYDARRIAIDRVGVKGVRHPIKIAGRAATMQHTVATIDMVVALPHDQKGAHMSRFVELLNAQDTVVSSATMRVQLSEMLKRLESSSGSITMRFPYFIKKRAPVTGMASLMDYDVVYYATSDSAGEQMTVSVTTPVTSLCPCSKEISEYGAHNQRSHITIKARSRADIDVEDLIAIAEREASSELYGVLKRPDEKFVTERAYDNPKFVEDLVRDVAAGLELDSLIEWYSVEVENFESIHNHSAFAAIEKTLKRS